MCVGALQQARLSVLVWASQGLQFQKLQVGVGKAAQSDFLELYSGSANLTKVVLHLGLTAGPFGRGGPGQRAEP